MFKELPKAVRIEKEPLHLVSDPETERSATAIGISPVTAKDPQGSDGLLLEVLFVVSFEKPVSIQRPGVIAVGAGGAFEQGELIITLSLGSKNPNRHIDAPKVVDKKTQGLGSTQPVATLPETDIKRGGVEARYDRFSTKSERRAAACEGGLNCAE